MTLYEIAMPMRFSFRHALASRSQAHNLLVCLRTDDGTEGWGEAIPRSYLTGETSESAWADLRDRWWPQVRGCPLPADPRAMLAPLYTDADALRKTASYAALDVAVVHAASNCHRIPVPDLLRQWMPPFQADPLSTPSSPSSLPGDGTGSFPEPGTAQNLTQTHGQRSAPPLTAPLGGHSVKRVVRLARIFRFLGFKHFKIKVGLGEDAEKVLAARHALGAGADLRVDANAAFHVEDALAFAHATRAASLSAFEQPIPPGDPQAMHRIQVEGGIPVMADESLCTQADAAALQEAGGVAVWNLRLAKVGGYTGVLTLGQQAITVGVALHLGVLVGQTSLLAGAERACMAVLPLRYMEYGFPRLLLRGDPVRGGPGGYRGEAYPPAAVPGCGIRVLPSALSRVCLRSGTWT